jgi:hypothetical protein
MDKQDLTQYGEQELSLHVMNTEHLYRQFMRCDDESDLRRVVDPEFTYTDEQFEELVDDLEHKDD